MKKIDDNQTTKKFVPRTVGGVITATLLLLPAVIAFITSVAFAILRSRPFGQLK